MRRVELGKSQADVAFESEVLTQTTVSELERGKYGPEDLTAARLSALAKGLNWTVAELENATGLELGLTLGRAEEILESVAAKLPSAVRRGPPIPPRLDAVEIPLEIPQGLQEAIERYSGVHPEFTVEQNLRAITSIYRYGGGTDFTPEEWLDIMTANRRWLVKP